MKKILALLLLVIAFSYGVYFAIVYYTSYSEGTRSGELIKFSKKGIFFKTYEGEISQGISGAQIFNFSVETKEQQTIEKLIEYQGRYVKLTYKERFGTFPWLGDTKYFITKVTLENSPHFNKLKEKKPSIF